MDPTKSVKKDILEFIKKRGQITAKEIQANFPVSQVTVFKHIKNLLETGKVSKVGTTPKVYYFYNPENELIKTTEKIILNNQDKELFDKKFIDISPEGLIKEGFEGFEIWCEKQNLDLKKTTQEFIKTWQKYLQFYTSINQIKFIDASFKLKESYGEKAVLDGLIYLDFYAIERFGKTRLAQLTFQAKQSQDGKLINLIIEETKAQIEFLIKQNKIDAVGFVPPTVKRKVQFMSIFEQKLGLKLPKIEIDKVIYDTPVQQKSLKNKTDRILNATKTFYIPNQNKYQKILLIDDFIGSGATLNQIGEKIKQNGIAKKVIGMALTGSFKGFEVINQV